MSSRCTICVFAKAPVPGQVKTRLAASVGEPFAALLARAFLEDTWSAVQRLDWAERVLATTSAAPEDFGFLGEVEPWLQGEGDLGARLEHIARRALEASERVLMIGADSPGLPVRFLEQARDALAEADAVLGPADDGGFYLVGLRRCPRGLFEELPWSAPTTCAATRARLASHDLTVALLSPWFDVDTPLDLARLRGLLAQGQVHAPATERVLLAAREKACEG